MTLLTRFFELNRRASERITQDHIHETNVFGFYKKLATILLSHPRVSKVVDVGAGKAWQLPSYYKNWYGIELIGLDIDGSEMKNNDTLDQKIVCDVVAGIPLADGQIDLIMVHSGIEHFSDNEHFLRNAFRILRPGGFLLAQFPGRFAPFAMANRLLPDRLAKHLLRVAMGDTDELGFRAYYDRTNYSAFKHLCGSVGFDEIYHMPGYYSSSYFARFVPAYMASYVYDVVRYGLGIRDLASYNLFLLQKPGSGPDPEPLRLYAWRR
jgi:SAM-dependent methyltransferase